MKLKQIIIKIIAQKHLRLALSTVLVSVLVFHSVTTKGFIFFLPLIGGAGGSTASVVAAGAGVAFAVPKSREAIVNYFENCMDSDGSSIRPAIDLSAFTSAEREDLLINPWFYASRLDTTGNTFQQAAEYDVNKVVKYMQQMASGVSKCRVHSWEEGANKARDFFECKWKNLDIDCGYGYRQHATKCISECNQIAVLEKEDSSDPASPYFLNNLQECSIGGMATDTTTCGTSSAVCDADIMGKTFSVLSVAFSTMGGGNVLGNLIKMGVSQGAQESGVTDTLVGWTGIPKEWRQTAFLVGMESGAMFSPSEMPKNIVKTAVGEKAFNTAIASIEEGCKLGMKNDKVMSEMKAKYTCMAIAQGFKIVLQTIATSGANIFVESGQLVLDNFKQIAKTVILPIAKDVLINLAKTGVTIGAEAITDQVCLPKLSESLGNELKAQLICDGLSQAINTIASIAGGTLQSLGSSTASQLVEAGLLEISAEFARYALLTGFTVAEAHLCANSSLSGAESMICSLGLANVRMAMHGNFGLFLSIATADNDVSGYASLPSSLRESWSTVIQEIGNNNQEFNESSAETNLARDELYNTINRYLTDNQISTKVNSQRSRLGIENFANDCSSNVTSSGQEFLNAVSKCRLFTFVLASDKVNQLDNITDSQLLEFDATQITIPELVAIGLSVDDAATCQIAYSITTINSPTMPEHCRLAAKINSNNDVFEAVAKQAQKAGIALNAGIISPRDADGFTQLDRNICGELMATQLADLYLRYRPDQPQAFKRAVKNPEICRAYLRLLKETANSNQSSDVQNHSLLSQIALQHLQDPDLAALIRDEEYTSTVEDSIAKFEQTPMYLHIMDKLPNYVKWKNPNITQVQAEKYARVLVHAAYIKYIKLETASQSSSVTPTEEDYTFYNDPDFYNSQLDPTGITNAIKSFSDEECVTLRNVGNFIPDAQAIEHYLRKYKRLSARQFVETGEIFQRNANGVKLVIP